jgi:hypothetical protein
MDDIQHPASLPGRHRIARDDTRHDRDELRVTTIQQIDPLMTVRDQPAQLVLISVTLARDEMVDQLRPRPPSPCPVWVVSCNRTVKVASAGCGSGLVRRVLRGIGQVPLPFSDRPILHVHVDHGHPILASIVIRLGLLGAAVIWCTREDRLTRHQNLRTRPIHQSLPGLDSGSHPNVLSTPRTASLGSSTGRSFPVAYRTTKPSSKKKIWVPPNHIPVRANARLFRPFRPSWQEKNRWSKWTGLILLIKKNRTCETVVIFLLSWAWRKDSKGRKV